MPAGRVAASASTERVAQNTRASTRTLTATPTTAADTTTRRSRRACVTPLTVTRNRRQTPAPNRPVMWMAFAAIRRCAADRGERAREQQRSRATSAASPRGSPTRDGDRRGTAARPPPAVSTLLSDCPATRRAAASFERRREQSRHTRAMRHERLASDGSNGAHERRRITARAIASHGMPMTGRRRPRSLPRRDRDAGKARLVHTRRNAAKPRD